jgi:tripartite-type tricarboxylate transporter receptor subunit TctC
MRRRQILRPLLAAPFILPGIAAGQPAAGGWPSRPVRIVVVFPPGGSSDIAARVLAEHYSQRLGQRFLVDNRPGAGGILGADVVAKAPPDGHTLLLSNTAPIVTSPPQYPQTAYDPVGGFTHIAYIGATAIVIATHPSVPATDLKGLVAWVKAQRTPPGYGTSGAGSVGHFLGELFQRQTGTTLNHVPYRGSGPMLADLLGGSIRIAFDTLPQNVEHIKDKRLRGLAVSVARRSDMAPEVPTTAEAGFPELLAENWLGLSGPRGLPAPIVQRLHAETSAGLDVPAVRHRLDEHGIASRPMSPAEFQAFVAEEVRSVGGTIRAMGITAQ